MNKTFNSTSTCPGQTIVHTARQWLGTPFHHQSAKKGEGCDCLGLILGVAQELQIYSVRGMQLSECQRSQYHYQMDAESIRHEASEHLFYSSNPEIGGVVVYKPCTGYWHAGIIGDYMLEGAHTSKLSIIHSCMKRGVVEHRLITKTLHSASYFVFL